jgi:hypothetical protein
MGFSAKARRLPGRLAAGAFILNAGLGKWSADEETAARLHGMAVGTHARLLSASEIAIGSALLLPVVPAAAAVSGSRSTASPTRESRGCLHDLGALPALFAGYEPRS